MQNIKSEIKLTDIISKRNYNSLLWHAGFLALAQVFMDVDTIIPALLVDAGGSSIQIGLLSAIMLGGASFTQLFYAPFISNYHFKKKFLLIGINSRIFSLFGLTLMLFFISSINKSSIILLIFSLITIFSFGGAFANVSYTDILGKAIKENSRKSFFSVKQVITGIILFSAAFVAKKILTISTYPTNYAYMFFIACTALFFASLGFWNIKEIIPSRMSVKNPSHFYQLIKHELKENKQMKYFLGLINTMGISVTLLPFIILYAKHNSQTNNIGLFLIFKIIGSVTTAFTLLVLAGKYKYRYMLYSSAFLSLTLPLHILLFSKTPSFTFMFFIGGIIFTSYSISKSGILLEISSVKNRSLYAGIVGIGNIMPALFPLLGGWIIKYYGFQPFFLLYIFIIMSSFFFIWKINCKK